MATIPIASGSPTKNLGATIINAGNTPAGITGTNDATNSNAGFGVLTGGTKGGQGNFGKPVQSTTTSSGEYDQSPPGVIPIIPGDDFNVDPSYPIGPGITIPPGEIPKNPVVWKKLWQADDWSGKNDAGDKFGYDVSLTTGSNGIRIAVGAPSGSIEDKLIKSGWGYNERNEGHAEVWELKSETPTPGSGVGIVNPSGVAIRQTGLGRSRSRLGGDTGMVRLGQTIHGSDNHGTGIGARQDGDETGSKITFNSDGSRMAVGSPGDANKGSVRVYEYSSASGYWYKFGTKMEGHLSNDRFGSAMSLDGDGDTIFIGAPRPGGTGYCEVHQWATSSNPTGSWSLQYATSGNAPGDKYGHSVTTNSAGNLHAVGAPNASGTRGTADMFITSGAPSPKWSPLYFSGGTGASPKPVKRVVGSTSGERLGWSIHMMYASITSLTAGHLNPMVAVGSPYWSTTVANYNWAGKDKRQRDAGVPIYSGPATSGIKGVNDADGSAFQKYGLSSEGRTQVFGANKVNKPSKPVHYNTINFLPFGDASAKQKLHGSRYGSEFGYSVSFSKEGDFLAIGAPGTPSYEEALASEKDTYDLPNQKISGSGIIPNPPEWDPNVQRDYSACSVGSVEVFRYVWPGAHGDDARTQHWLTGENYQEDYWIKYGATLKGDPDSGFYNGCPWFDENKYGKSNLPSHCRGPNWDQHYRRPNFQNWGLSEPLIGASGWAYHPLDSNLVLGERFGTDVSILDMGKSGNAGHENRVPMLAIGAPYWVGNSRGISSKHLNTVGRASAYTVQFSKLVDNIMPPGAGRKGTGGVPIASAYTKPKITYAADGSIIKKAGGGQESYFASTQAGSGISNDNSRTSSRTTFNTGGTNKTI